jgi:2-polyprenyl-6-methoxyphenol hydroxylase-like FAD-dependent oxidoreductase
MSGIRSSTHVVVAGMGPVGLVAALSLARAGISVTVLEEGAKLAEESRASTFHPPSLEYLEALGVVDELHLVGLVAPTFQQRERRGGVLIELDLGLLADETRYPYRLQSEQDNLTRIIVGQLGTMDNVDLRFSSPVIDVTADASGVTVRTGGARDSLHADWLIGADGASSAVRHSLGIEFDGMTYPERFFVISTPFDFRDALSDLALVSYIADPEEWMVLLRTPRHWRALFPVTGDEVRADIEKPEAVQSRLQRVYSRRDPYPVLHTTLYHVHQRLARTMAEGRVLLAGDAAHINNPLGGLGMNSGIHDAVAAARVIIAAAGGVDPAACARAYGKIRRATVSKYVLADTARNFSELADSNIDARARRAAELAALAEDPEAQRTQLRRTSMLTSAHESEAQLSEALAAAASGPAAAVRLDFQS